MFSINLLELIEILIDLSITIMTPAYFFRFWVLRMTCLIGTIPLLSDFAVFIFVGDLNLYAEPKAYQDQDQHADDVVAETKF